MVLQTSSAHVQDQAAEEENAQIPLRWEIDILREKAEIAEKTSRSHLPVNCVRLWRVRARNQIPLAGLTSNRQIIFKSKLGLCEV